MDSPQVAPAAPRVPTHTPATFVDKEGERLGVLFDLSRTGALLSTTGRCRPGTQGTLQLTSYRSRTVLSFTCRVARQADFPAVGIGLKFTGMGVAAQLWLNNYCAFFHERRRVVMLDRDTTALASMERVLTTEGYKFVGIETVDKCELAVTRIQPALVLIDVALGERPAVQNLKARMEALHTPILWCHSEATAAPIAPHVLCKTAARDDVVAAVRAATLPTLS